MKHLLLTKVESSPISALPIWLKRNPEVLNWLLNETNQYENISLSERLYIFINGIPPKCEDGNYRKFNTFTKGYRSGCHLGNKCKSVSIDRVSNQQLTMLSKYGVTNSSQLDSVQQKIKNTNIRKYGVAHHSQNNEIKTKSKLTRQNKTSEQLLTSKQKTKDSNIIKYGVDHHMKLDSQQQKVKDTNIDRYGVAFPLQNEHSLTKMMKSAELIDRSAVNIKTKATLLEKYGVDAASRIAVPPETLAILLDKTKFCEFVTNKTRREVIDALSIAAHTLYLYAKKYEATELFSHPLRSQFEVDIAEYLTSIEVKFIQNDRSILAPQELDFYLPEHNIAIECCGVYWHSELSAGRNSNYHSSKHQRCKELGIQLITIFDDEWRDYPILVKQILNNKLNAGTRLFARKCEMKELTVDQAKEFVNKYHIQQYTGSSIRLGLLHDNEIVAVMTFSKSRFAKNKEHWEIVRYCSSVNVVGGASKLLKRFIDLHNPETIISYSDNRWFTGNLYKALGFTEGKTTVGYFYTDCHDRFTRLQFQKHKLVAEGHDQSLSEWEIMQQQKYDRIWDCGQIHWELQLRDKY